MIRVQIIEDDQDFVYLLTKRLEKEADMEIVSCNCDQDDCVRDALDQKPDIVILDLMLSAGERGALEGIGIAREIRLKTRAKILILTSLEQPGTVLAASMQAFASGYLFKSRYTQIPEAVRTVAAGSCAEEIMICSALVNRLTVSEYYVLLHYLGYEVDLHSSPKTISNQLSSIVRKFGLKKPDELTAVFSNYPDIRELYQFA